MHSGWGVLVVVVKEGGRPAIIERKRIEVIDEQAGEKKQPYHFAKTMTLNAAEKYLARCADDSQRMAYEAIRALAKKLRGRGYHIVRCAMLTASGRALPELRAILAAHPLIHTAEGEFFRAAISQACAALKIPVSRLAERDVEEQAKAALGKSTAAAMRQIAKAAETLGSPWTREHKTSALAAWMALAEGERVP